MRNSWHKILVAAAMAIATIPFFNHSPFQDDDKKTVEKSSGVVVVIDNDGNKLLANKFMINGKLLLSNEPNKVAFGFRTADGKLIVVDKDGNKNEIDVSDARSIIVNQSIKSSIQDGETTSTVFGKAIVIGADGVRHEYDLGTPGEIGENARKMFIVPAGSSDFSAFFADFGSDDNASGIITILGENAMQSPHILRLNLGSHSSKFMIGVGCQKLSENLRTQLGLDANIGLVVDSTIPDAPAAKANIKIHDILLKADKIDLTKIADLIGAVEKAGKSGNAISFSVIRNGKTLGIDVKPMTRPELDANGMGFFDFQFNSMGRGMIIPDDDESPDVFQAEMNALENEIKQMLETQKRLQEKLKNMKRSKQSKDDSKLKT